MSTAQQSNTARKYYKPKDGKFRLPSNENDPLAIREEFVDKSTGATGETWYRPYDFLVGVITGISFYEGQTKDGKKFKSLNIYLDPSEDGEEPVISMPVNGREAASILERLPNVDLSKEVRFFPYKFEDKGRRGVALAQKDKDGNFTVKITSFFKEGQDTKYLHDYPTPTEEDKSDWPFYFTKVNKFLVKYAEENILTKYSQENKSEEVKYPDEDINPEDIPF